ncbi:MAG: hypothetical protein GY765_30530 [bacterium]|nr:hypothetical protein [bacterium]
MKDDKVYGWTGKMLRVDLSTGIIEVKDSLKYVTKFIGGKGLNHRLAWDELSSGVKAFDPENCLFISVGPLTGTAAPNSGRATVGGIAAQSFPEMYSHSGFGGWFPAALKYAGYDAIIITGKSPQKCYLFIDGESINIERADDLWGLGTYDTQRLLKRKHGKESYSLCIGPAGENLSRIAVLLTDTENAAGQGGFGGVAGSKNLKGICVKGPNEVAIAQPERLLKLRKDNMQTPAKTPVMKNVPFMYDEQMSVPVPYRRNKVSCSHACDRHCFCYFHDVPGASEPTIKSGKWGCVGAEAAGWQQPFHVKWPLWGKLGRMKPGLVSGPVTQENVQLGFEVSRLINQYGLNAWDFLAGIVPWLVMADRAGVIAQEKEIFEQILPIDADSPDWWVNLIKTIVYRKGVIGDLLAEGNLRTIKALGDKFENTMYEGFGKKIPTKISLQAAWGYAGHWSGRGIHSGLRYPWYLTRALPWMTGTRDPMDDTHIRMTKEWESEIATIAKDKIDPYIMPVFPIVSIWNENRSELKSSLTLCDWAFPHMDNTALESQLLSAVTGIEYSEEDLDLVGERCKNMQRALLIRDYDRKFETEFNEIMPWFERPDGTEGISVDREKFKFTVFEYYKMRGWDENGRPTKETLDRLDLSDIADELVRLGKISG